MSKETELNKAIMLALAVRINQIMEENPNLTREQAKQKAIEEINKKR